MKDRSVYWFLFPLVGILCGYLHFVKVGSLNFLINTGFNLMFTAIILCALLIYIYIRTNRFSFGGALGLGDLLMFGALTVTFATITYSTLIVFGLLAALACHIIITKFNITLSRKHKQKHSKNSVPLAGYLALYFILIYVSNWSGLANTFYIL